MTSVGDGRDGAQVSPRLLLAALMLVASTATAQTSTRPGLPPQDAWTCPRTHPIKGNFTTHSGERCIYHMKGGQYYSKTKPERCYATEGEARQDGCRRSKR
jgi:hypothetical protein